MIYLSKFIESNENLPFSFENQYKRFSYITFFPIQSNASSIKNDDGSVSSWFQLVGNYKRSYNRIDEEGKIFEDENSINNILFLKIPYDLFRKHNISTTDLKKFFDENFVGKKFITLPVTDEMPIFEIKGSSRNIVKNQSQVYLDESFDLLDFMNFVIKSKAK